MADRAPIAGLPNGTSLAPGTIPMGPDSVGGSPPPRRFASCPSQGSPLSAPRPAPPGVSGGAPRSPPGAASGVPAPVCRVRSGCGWCVRFGCRRDAGAPLSLVPAALVRRQIPGMALIYCVLESPAIARRQTVSFSIVVSAWRGRSVVGATTTPQKRLTTLEAVRWVNDTEIRRSSWAQSGWCSARSFADDGAHG